MSCLNNLKLNRPLAKALLCLLLFTLFGVNRGFALGFPPAITVQPSDQTVPINGTANFQVTASSGTTMFYQWFKNGAPIPFATLSSLTIANVQTGDQGTYAVNITNAVGYVTSSNALLTVLTQPIITTPPASQAVALGGSVGFSVTATGLTPFSYQWLFNGTNTVDSPNLSGSTTSMLTVSNAQTNNAGGYSVIVTNALGSATSAVATLTVVVPPVVTSPPVAQVVVQGQSASFTVAASGTALLYYQWRLNGTNLAGANNATLTLTNVQLAQAGSYSATVANAAGLVTSPAAALTVYAPPVITTQPLSQSVVLGTNFSLTAAVSGTAPLNYQWNFNGTNLAGATNLTLAFNNIQPAQAGSYAVTVSNNWGAATSASATVTVLVPAGIATQPQSQAVTSGNAVSFSVVPSGTAPFSYQWYFNGVSLGSGGLTSTYSISHAATGNAGNYTVVVNNNYGSVTSVVATLAVYLAPSISGQPSSVSLIQGQTATFSVTASGSPSPSYQWNVNGINLVDGPIVSYYAGATNVTYVSGSATSTVTISNVQPAQAGNVFATVTNLGGSLISNVKTLTVYVPATITNPPVPQAVVAGTTANFSVGAVGTATVKYQWYFNGVSLGSSSGGQTATYTASSVSTNNAGNYSVVVYNNYGTVTNPPVSLTVLGTQPINQTVGVGQSASFSVGVSSSSPLSYQWKFNGANLPGATNATLTLTSAQTNQIGNYAAVITSPGGVLNSSAATLNVLTIPAYMVLNTSDSGAGSLRQAILNVNAGSGRAAIVFQIPGSGPFTISPLSLLPTITQPALLDATTQPGWSGPPIVQVSGSSLPNGTVGDGLVINAGGCTVKGLDISSFPGNGLTLTNSAGNVIQGNYVGCALDGVSKLGNSSYGILLYNSASNVVGGTSALTRNVVVYSGSDGIHLEGTGAAGNQIVGNIVGMDATGQLKVQGVGGSAIVLNNAPGNLIGGTNSGSGNVCASGISGSGLVISGTSAAFNVVQGNLIGTDITGTVKAGCVTGINILNAPSNTIGGLTFAAGNVIAGNGGNGIALSGLTAQFNVIQGNFIGTDRSGTVALKNSSAGVSSTTAINNTVGGLATGAGNIIGNNGGSGVIVSGGQCAILMNSLYGNGGSSPNISLLNAGNLNAVPPVLKGVTNNTSLSQIAGVLTNYPNNTYRLEFYASPGSADARTFLGATNVVTSPSGVATFNVLLNTGNLTNQYLTATATDASGNTSQISVSKSVTYYGAPFLVSGPISQTVTQGMTATMSVTLADTGPFTYQWQMAGNNVAGATNSTLTIPNIQLGQAGSYQVTYSSSAGAATTQPASLIVVPASTTNSPTLQGLVVHLTFDGNLTDTSGRGNHAAAVGAPNFVPGIIGAQAFNPYTGANGANNYATLGAPADLSFGATNDFSIAFWARLPAGASSGGSYFEPPFIANKNFSAYANTGWALAAGPGGRFEWNYSEGTAMTYLGSGGTFGTPTRHHLAVTFRRGGNAVAYVDGVPVSSNSIAPGGGSIDPGLPTNLGSDGTGAYPAAYGYFTNVLNIPTNGLAMDDLGIWRRALLPTEVGAIYNAGLAGQDFSTVTTANLSPVLPQITQQPASVELGVGGTTNLAVTASGPSPFGYQWYGNGALIPGANGASLILSNVQPAQAGPYYVVLYNFASSLTSAVATVTVDLPPTITTQPQSQAVTAGQSAGLTVAASGTAPFKYQWTFNGAPLSGATNALFTLASMATNNVGVYQVVVTNTWGAATSAVATLSLFVPPVIATQPQSQSVTQGLSAAFSVVATGANPLSFQWRFNGTSVSGATNSTFSLASVLMAQAGNYSVVVTNPLGAVTSAVATLTVLLPPSRPYTAWLSTAGATTDTGAAPTNWDLNNVVSFDAPQLSYGANTTYGTFRVEAGFQPPQPIREFYYVNSSIYIGDPGVGYQLLPGDLLVTFNVTTPVTIGGVNNVTRTDVMLYRPGPGHDYANGTFSMLLENPIVEAGSVLNVHAIDLVEQDTLIGNKIIPKGTFLFAHPPKTEHMNVYTYTPHSVGQGTTTTGSDTCTLLLDGNKLGNTGSQVKGIYLVPQPVRIGGTILNTGQLLMCVGGSFSINPTTQNYPVVPTDCFILNVTATEQDPTPNTVATAAPFFNGANVGLLPTVSNNQLMCLTLVDWANLVPILMNQPASQSVLLGGSSSFAVTAKGGTSTLAYQWTLNGAPVAGATNTALTLSNVQTNNGGSYALVVTNFAGSVTSAVATLTVLVPAGIATQPQSQTVVAGQSASLAVVPSGTAPFGYQWYFNGASLGVAGTAATLLLNPVGTNNAGSYFVVVTNNYGSVTSALASLTVNVAPGITAQPASQIVTQGSGAIFSVQAGGTAPLSYQWTFNNSALAGATNATFPIASVQTNNAGVYAVVVTNIAGSVISSNATLTVNFPPGITSQPRSQTAIQGSNVVFSVVAGGTVPFTYQWTFNNTNLVGATNATLVLAGVQTNNAGIYAVQVANAAGATLSSNAALAVLVPPTILTQPVSQTVVQGSNVVFAVMVSGTAPFGYQWTLNGTNLPAASDAPLALTVGVTNNPESNFSTLTLNNVQTNAAGIYAVVITNAAGFVTSSNVTLTVLVPPAITSGPLSQTVAAGQNAALAVAATGTGPLAYQWSFGSATLLGETNATLNLNNVSLAQAGDYTVVVTNAAGAATSAATLSVTNTAVILTTAKGAMTTGGFAFQASVPLGATYVVQASTNLQTWLSIYTNMATSASEAITDADAASYSRRFYRVLLP